MSGGASAPFRTADQNIILTALSAGEVDGHTADHRGCEHQVGIARRRLEGVLFSDPRRQFAASATA